MLECGTANGQAVNSPGKDQRGTGVYILLWVEHAERCLNNADGLIVRRDGIESVLAVPENSNELQAHILGMHLGAKRVRHRFRLASGDLDRVTGSGQVTQELALG